MTATRVSVLGRGRMGSALARALVAGGAAVTVWNRAPGAATALDCALLAYLYGSHLAMLHGAALCDSEQLPQRFYFNVLRALGPRLGDRAETARAMVERENYSDTDNTLAVHLATLRHVQRLSHDNEVDPRLPDALLQLCREAAGAGHGEDELASGFEILRRRAE